MLVVKPPAKSSSVIQQRAKRQKAKRNGLKFEVRFDVSEAMGKRKGDTVGSLLSDSSELSHHFRLIYLVRYELCLEYPMNKKLFFNTLIDTLRQELLHAVNASKDAAEYATNEESRAESQWDTQGLEASYLAAGQASQAKQWAEAIEELQSEREDLLKPNNRVSLGALFKCDLGGSEEAFFFAGVAGGQVIQMENMEVTVITSHSPLAARLLGLKVGESFRLPNGEIGQILHIE